MGEIILECQFITPTFIYGVKNEPELRVPSIKGLMRFWWRATYKEFVDLKTMRNKESDIFGGKIVENGKEVFKKARVQILSKLIGKKITRTNEKLFINDWSDKKGLKYLFYFMNISNNQDKSHFSSGTQFEIIFKYQEKNKEYVKEYLRAFNTLQLFGGIGARSKRGAGSFIIDKVESSEFTKEKIEEYIYAENSNKSILDYYEKILQNTRQNNNRKYPNLVDNNAEIYLCSFNDENENNNSLDGNASSITYEDKLNCIGESYKILRENTECKKSKKRCSSPLIIKVIKVKKEYEILLIKLAGEFIENYLIEDFFENCNPENKIKNMENLKEGGLING